ncbi:unnamed protein product [Parnassius mnemosyne]|uniref:Reverse transcriptase domain-containing protein n=1 Tax=Parnassius mnemosyne TaxID=213953 RepID=A0AAV1LQ81_9NEOP
MTTQQTLRKLVWQVCLQKLKDSCLGVKLGDIKVNCLLYADDAVLIAPSEAELQALVTCMKEECEIKGLRLNANKTKVLVFERDEERTKCEIWIYLILWTFITPFYGKSTSGINEEIIWISISMAIAIAVLIAIALCYILKEKCSKRQAYREQS